MNIVRERVAGIRKEKGMTQIELAKMSYVSNQVISNIERGITKTASPTVVGLLAYALVVTEDYLTGDSEERDRTADGKKPLILLMPRWDYKYEISQLLRHQEDKKVENLMRDITIYLTNKEKNSIGFKILKTIMKTIKNNDSKKELMILLDIIKAFDKKEKENENVEW